MESASASLKGAVLISVCHACMSSGSQSRCGGGIRLQLPSISELATWWVPGRSEALRRSGRLFAAKTPVVSSVRAGAIGFCRRAASRRDFLVALPRCPASSCTCCAKWALRGYSPSFSSSPLSFFSPLRSPSSSATSTALDMLYNNRAGRVPGEEALAIGPVCDPRVPPRTGFVPSARTLPPNICPFWRPCRCFHSAIPYRVDLVRVQYVRPPPGRNKGRTAAADGGLGSSGVPGEWPSGGGGAGSRTSWGS